MDENPGKHDGTKQRCHNSCHQSNSESFNWPHTKTVKDNCHKKGCDVRVYNRTHCTGIATVNGRTQCLSSPHLFPNPVKNQYVCIHRSEERRVGKECRNQTAPETGGKKMTS